MLDARVSTVRAAIELKNVFEQIQAAEKAGNLDPEQKRKLEEQAAEKVEALEERCEELAERLKEAAAAQAKAVKEKEKAEVRSSCVRGCVLNGRPCLLGSACCTPL